MAHKAPVLDGDEFWAGSPGGRPVAVGDRRCGVL